MMDELEDVIHHTLGNLSGEQIKADGGSSAPAIARAVRAYYAEQEAKLEAIQRTRRSTKGEPQALADGLACLLGDPE